MQRRWLLLLVPLATAGVALARPRHHASHAPRAELSAPAECAPGAEAVGADCTTRAEPVGGPCTTGGERAAAHSAEQEFPASGGCAREGAGAAERPSSDVGAAERPSDEAGVAERPSDDARRDAGAPRATVAELLATDLAAAPEQAPAAIHELAARARGTRDHDDAARALTRWLRDETRRDGTGAADARGNVPNIVEALGELGGDLAVRALVDALADDRYELSIKTLIVQELGTLHDPAATAAVARFAAVAERAPVTNDLEAALRDEALAAADETGRLLHH
jgi:hypothetical protein